MAKFSRFLNHIRQRTVVDRMLLEWRKRVKEKRADWWQCQIGKREHIDTKTDRGVRIRLHFDSELARLIYVDDFERTEREFLKAYLRPGDIFVDVGANIGLFSLIAAQLVGPSGKVFAFEPTQRIYDRLANNVNLNGFRNLSIYRLALSDHIGRQAFFVSKDGFDAWNSFAQPVAGESFQHEEVQCETWDHFADENGLIGNVAMMKIDVEGWETHILAGAQNALNREDAPVLQVEFTDAVAAAAGTSCRELYRALEDLGYRMFTYDPLRRQLRNDPIRESYPYVNLIALKSREDTNSRLREGDSL